MLVRGNKMKHNINGRYLFISVIIFLSAVACQVQPTAAPEKVEVSQKPPSASFLVAVDSGSAPLVVEFSNTS